MPGVFSEHGQRVIKALRPHGLLRDVFVVDEEMRPVQNTHHRTKTHHYPSEIQRYYLVEMTLLFG